MEYQFDGAYDTDTANTLPNVKVFMKILEG